MLNLHAIAGGWFISRRFRGAMAGASRRRSRRAWGIEALEGRALLSVYLVDSLGDAGVGSGQAGDLRYAINQADQATDDSTIVFAPTLDGQQITLTQGMLTIDKPSGDLTILGPGAGELSISGGDATQVLAVSSASHATISGLTLTGGAWLQGAGIANDGQLTLAMCTVTGNTAYGSGGGGIANGSDGTLTVLDSTVSGNVASTSDGGGIANAGSMTILDSTVSGNASRGGSGGGIANTGTLSVDESTISGNRAIIDYDGGGIYNTASLTLTDDTISDNTAKIDGGGLANEAILGGTVVMDNTIVANNVSLIDGGTSDVFDNGDPTGSNLTGGYDLVEVGDLGSLTHTMVGVDPQLGPLQNNGGPTWTQAIPVGSPAAGAGDPALVPAGDVTDQRGFPYARVAQGQLDLGAFEIQSARHEVVASPASSAPGARSTEFLLGLTIASDGQSPARASTGDGIVLAAMGRR